MSDALSYLALSDDGHIVLGPDAAVTAMTDEAARLLDIDPALPRVFDDIATDLLGWADVQRAVAEGQRTDIHLRGPSGRRLLASLRRAPGTGHVGLIELRDLDQFDYRRDRALGVLAEQPLRTTVDNRTRPDFATQRRLSPALNRLLSRGERAIRQGARILITGESGVGKSEIARFLHGVVADARDPFVIVNCATDQASKLDAALFAEGGLIDQATGATLFLDEVAEIPLSVQARLLGFLEDGVARSTGPRRGPPLQLIAATNADLQALVREGCFRADLYYRIAVIGLAVPPLRQMPDLIGHLTDRFLQTINQRRVTPVILPRRLRDLLDDYAFPGNIRELLNIVQRAAIFMEDATDMEELFAELLAPVSDTPDLSGVASLDLRSEVRRFERALIDKAIRLQGSKRKAAKLLGVDIGTIVRKTAETVGQIDNTFKRGRGE